MQDKDPRMCTLYYIYTSVQFRDKSYFSWKQEILKRIKDKKEKKPSMLNNSQDDNCTEHRLALIVHLFACEI